MDGSRTWMSSVRPRCLDIDGRRAVVLTVALLLPGCLGRGDSELLEANLRQHQDQIATYRHEVKELKEQLTIARAESDQLRRELVAVNRDARQEVTEPLVRVSGIS